MFGRVLIEAVVLENFAKFTGSLLLIKRPATLLKKKSTRAFSCEY